jgi:dTDP-4-dehydrorhamnose reductase
MKFLITGKNGQLAQAFIKKLEERSIDFSAPDESQLDITNQKVVANLVATLKPDVIVNCAAYNLVDNAEQARDTAFAVNASGPKYLAQAAASQKAILVHFGSDYVFDGLKESSLYTESDPVNPLNEYGKSKLAGENFVLEELDRCLVLRLSWVFGAGKQNFIYKLIQWSKDSDFLKIACDEFSVPTHTGTVVDITLKAIEQGMTGRYHLTNSGFCSRYEWARLILNAIGVNKFVRPVTMDTFKLLATRPKFSAMSNTRLADRLNVNIPSWEESVRSFLRERASVHE